MPRVVYLPEAREDIYSLWRHVLDESRSLVVADRLVDWIEEGCEAYARQPEMGELRPDLAAGLRCFHVKSYVVFYLALPDGIEVVQIIHGVRDVPARFRFP
jgi:toxin ParE1/3/4